MAVIRTPRLSLRALEPDDTDSLLAVFGDEEVMRFGFGARDRDWVRDWIVKHADGIEPRDSTAALAPFTVVLEATGEVIGYCGFFATPDVRGRDEIELGYRLARAHWGRGYATEAARALVGYARDRAGLLRLISLIDPANTPSIRVATKIGMRLEGEAMLPGYDHPDHVYAMQLSEPDRERESS